MSVRCPPLVRERSCSGPRLVLVDHLTLSVWPMQPRTATRLLGREAIVVIMIREWLAPMVAAGVAIVVLALWIWFISKVNHGGGSRKPRKIVRSGLSSLSHRVVGEESGVGAGV